MCGYILVPSTLKAKEEKPSQIPGQPGLCREFQDDQSCRGSRLPLTGPGWQGTHHSYGRRGSVGTQNCSLQE